MNDWWPETSVQELARLDGYLPRDGAPGVNFERGDFAQGERLPRSAGITLTDERVAELLEDVAARGREYVAKWR